MGATQTLSMPDAAAAAAATAAERMRRALSQAEAAGVLTEREEVLAAYRSPR